MSSKQLLTQYLKTFPFWGVIIPSKFLSMSSSITYSDYKKAKRWIIKNKDKADKLLLSLKETVEQLRNFDTELTDKELKALKFNIPSKQLLTNGISMFDNPN